MKPLPSKRLARAGFTVLELSIGVVLLLVLSGVVMQTLDSMKRMALVGDAQGRLQRDAERALDVIVQDLRRTGFCILDGRQYPHFVVNGEPADDYAVEAGVHYHLPATKTAEPDDPDFGPDVGLLFVLPAMWPDAALDGDPEMAKRWPYGRPVVVTDTKVYGPGQAIDSGDPGFQLHMIDEDEDIYGALVWNVGNPVSYSLRTDAVGRNTLVRADERGAYRVVARDVERLVFESAADDGTIPKGSVRVRIFFRVPDRMGAVQRFRVEATVRLRNGETEV